MACNTLKLISPEAANAAYADGIRKARRLRELAQTKRKIADALHELIPDMVYSDSSIKR